MPSFLSTVSLNLTFLSCPSWSRRCLHSTFSSLFDFLISLFPFLFSSIFITHSQTLYSCVLLLLFSSWRVLSLLCPQFTFSDLCLLTFLNYHLSIICACQPLPAHYLFIPIPFSFHVLPLHLLDRALNLSTPLLYIYPETF